MYDYFSLNNLPKPVLFKLSLMNSSDNLAQLLFDVKKIKDDPDNCHNLIKFFLLDKEEQPYMIVYYDIMKNVTK